MGFFDDVGNFFNDTANKVGGFFQNQVAPALATVGNGVQSVFQEQIIPFFSSAGSELKGAIGGVYNDIKDVVKGNKETIDNLINKGADTIQHGTDVVGGTISSLGNSLTMPLVLVGGGILAIMLLKS